MLFFLGSFKMFVMEDKVLQRIKGFRTLNEEFS